MTNSHTSLCHTWEEAGALLFFPNLSKVVEARGIKVRIRLQTTWQKESDTGVDGTQLLLRQLPPERILQYNRSAHSLHWTTDLILLTLINTIHPQRERSTYWDGHSGRPPGCIDALIEERCGQMVRVIVTSLKRKKVNASQRDREREYL